MQVYFGEQIFEFSRNLQKVNWNLFRKNLGDALQNVELHQDFTIQELERATRSFNNALIDTIDVLAPIPRKIAKKDSSGGRMN